MIMCVARLPAVGCDSSVWGVYPAEQCQAEDDPGMAA